MAAAGATVAFLAGMLAFAGTGTASAQEPVLIQAEVTTQQDATTAEEASCETNELGMLDTTPGSVLEASGRWTTEDCDSRFRSDSDAHTYRFEIAETGRIRIDVISSGRDSYMYLLDEDGNRISENDDGGAGALSARIERELQAGVYQIEATTTAGRVRGPADFEVVVTQVAGCDPEHLGALSPGQDLEATGFWTLESCQSVFLTGHPSHYFTFSLPQGARVRVDLKSKIGDPVLIVAPAVALRSVVPGQVAHNDDAGGTRDSRIEQYLPPDVYGIEATTFRDRDLLSPLIDFTLTLTIVEEEGHLRSPLLKIEEIDIPTEVVAGDPLPVNYRIGNLGGDEFPDDGGYAIAYTIGPRVFDRIGPLLSALWPAGVAYHTGEGTASATSTAASAVTPLSVAFNSAGPNWLFTAVIAFDGNEEEIGFHGLWHDLLVLSGATYDPVVVEVDGVAYSVSATADREGEVTAAVISVADPDAEVDAATREKAQYAAGVRTQLMNGIFNRPALADLSESAEPVEVDVTGPASSSLLAAFAAGLSTAVGGSGLGDSVADREAISPVAVEDLVLTLGALSSGEYASIAASWRALLESFESGGALSFEQAAAVQSQLAYAESVIAPAVAAGEIVAAARAAEQGWDDPEVQLMLSGQPDCQTGDDPLNDPLAFAGIEDADALKELDTELRAALVVYRASVDGVLCAIENVDAANFRFLERLGLDQSEPLYLLVEPESLPDPELEEQEAPTHRLRVLARLGGDGRIEHGVELFGGAQILPERRFLPADTRAGTWYATQDVDLDGNSLGQIRARRLADGRVELGFRDADGEVIAPDFAFLPADLDAGVWYRSSLVEVPFPATADEETGPTDANG